MCGTLCRKAPLCVLLVCWLGSAASANVNLEWRLEPPVSGLVRVGDTVKIGLFAVSDDATDQAMKSLQVIFTWDPASLQLLGALNNGVPWFTAGFFNNSLNESNPPLDGDGIYFALAPLSPPLPAATPAGILVTTLQFRALATTCGTVLNIPASIGAEETIVFGEGTPTPHITGTLGQISVAIGDAVSLDCDGNGQPDECQADLDGDGVINPCDNCKRVANPGQADADKNGFGDACDLPLPPPPDLHPAPQPIVLEPQNSQPAPAPIVLGPQNSQPAPAPVGVSEDEGAPASVVEVSTGTCAPMGAASMSMCLVGILLMQWTHRRRRRR